MSPLMLPAVTRQIHEAAVLKDLDFVTPPETCGLGKPPQVCGAPAVALASHPCCGWSYFICQRHMDKSNWALAELKAPTCRRCDRRLHRLNFYPLGGFA